MSQASGMLGVGKHVNVSKSLVRLQLLLRTLSPDGRGDRRMSETQTDSPDAIRMEFEMAREGRPRTTRSPGGSMRSDR